MVSYGDSSFREWAEENGFDDADVRLMQRTAGKRALMWFCIPWAFARIALIPGQDSWIAVADMLFVGFFNPFFVQAWTCYKCVKQVTFDNPRSGLLLKLFCFIKVVSCIFLIPLLLQLLFVKRGFGTGWRGLTKKGKIGNHPG